MTTQHELIREAYENALAKWQRIAKYALNAGVPESRVEAIGAEGRLLAKALVEVLRGGVA